MRAMDDLADTVGFYRDFADRQVKGESATFVEWSDGVARDEELLTLLGELPEARRQPNLLFAAARWHGAAAPAPFAELRRVVTDRWPEVRATMLERTTQTNEAGRCAALLPVLAGLPGPLALVEVGASAGLCLHPDRYSYRYVDGDGRLVRELHPAGGASPVVLECEVDGPVPVPGRLPEVVWRGGLDLNPLDITDPGTVRWLETLVWPEHEDRRARLVAAAELVADDPVHLLRGDAARLGEAVAAARSAAPDATVVVMHSAVAAYFPGDQREAWPAEVSRVVAADGRACWVSQEGVEVLPEVTATAACAQPVTTSFCLAVDGQAVGWTHGHGRSVRWC